MLRPLNSRSQTVLVSWGQGTWDTGSLSHLLSCEQHLWSPRCSVQCSSHLLHQRPLWLPPEAAIWKSPKGQQQVREGCWGVLRALLQCGVSRGLGPGSSLWAQLVQRDVGDSRLPLGSGERPVGVALSFFLPEKGSSLPRTASFWSPFPPSPRPRQNSFSRSPLPLFFFSSLHEQSCSLPAAAGCVSWGGLVDAGFENLTFHVRERGRSSREAVFRGGQQVGRWVTWGREGHTAISKEDRSVQREALCHHLGLVVVVRLD